MTVAARASELAKVGQRKRWRTTVKSITVNWELYLLLAPAMLYIVVFKYIPIYGVQIAFRDFDPIVGITGSPWVGFQWFQQFFDNYQFWPLIRNTLTLSLFTLLAGFPVPIIVATMLNQLYGNTLRRWMQTILYAPHFISTVVVVGMLFVFLSPSTGLVNLALKWVGGKPIFFMASVGWFQPLYVLSGIWQETGWGTIIYLAALTQVNPALHEAAMIDGAGRFRRIWHIDLPSIRPVIVILLVLAIGNIMNVGFEKVYLMQTDLNLSISEVIPTYVYKTGLLQAQYSFATAVGVFNAVINFVLLILANQFAKRLTGDGLF